VWNIALETQQVVLLLQLQQVSHQWESAWNPVARSCDQPPIVESMECSRVMEAFQGEVFCHLCQLWIQ
jgi:hypothetical protein